MDIRGLTVHELWIEGASEIASEYYASVVFDRSAKAPLVMLSTKGGMDIEQVADEDPDAIARLHVDPLLGFQDFHGRRLAFEAGVDADVVRPVGAMLAKLYEVFIAEEATLVEVNPLIVTPERDVKALDAKVTLDGNALFRHGDNAELRDLSAEDPQELMAKERGLTYVKLDGDIGILGNGAGLVMSTLDVVAQAGGAPANFLDAGGGSRADAITERGRGDPLRPQGQGRAVQHLRRHHPLRRGGARPDRGLQPDQSDGPVRRAPGRHQRRRGPARCWPRRSCPTCHAESTMDGAAAQGRGTGGRVSILVDKNTRLVRVRHHRPRGHFHSLRNRDYGTQVVAGVTPGKGGQDVEGIPVFNTFHEAVERAGANTAMVFVPPRFAADSILEAEDAGIELIICITEGIPAHDELRVYNTLKKNGRSRLIGPNCPGILSPGKANVGIIPAAFFSEGNVGRGVALGHADLPDRQRAGPERVWQLLDRRHRRRPGAGHRLHRRDRDVPGRPGDRADRDVRRDRRRRRGARRRVHRRQRHQAGGRLHRRLHRAAGEDHGPRRRDRVRARAGPRRPRPRRWRAKGVRVGRTPTQVAEVAVSLLGSAA